jgi:regulator of sirC expression with transglutaminase-like and TPR domain
LRVEYNDSLRDSGDCVIIIIKGFYKERMENQSIAKTLFGEMVSRRDEEVELAEAALLFAKEEYPDLDIEKYLTKLDLMAKEIKCRVKRNNDPHLMISEMNKYLFVDEGFKGNEDHYYDPKNSFLNDVLDRKTGIPISLSVLYIEIANRLSLPMVGVGFPGHFIVKYSGLGKEILIDPFNKGIILLEKECKQIIDRIYGGTIQLQTEFLEAVTKKQILIRMLNNLKGIYLNSKSNLKALSIVDLLLLINPVAMTEIRDRGILYYNLECFAQALSDLETYIRGAPQAQDVELIRGYIPLLEGLAAKIN